MNDTSIPDGYQTDHHGYDDFFIGLDRTRRHRASTLSLLVPQASRSRLIDPSSTLCRQGTSERRSRSQAPSNHGERRLRTTRSPSHSKDDHSTKESKYPIDHEAGLALRLPPDYAPEAHSTHTIRRSSPRNETHPDHCCVWNKTNNHTQFLASRWPNESYDEREDLMSFVVSEKGQTQDTALKLLSPVSESFDNETHRIRLTVTKRAQVDRPEYVSRPRDSIQNRLRSQSRERSQIEFVDGKAYAHTTDSLEFTDDSPSLSQRSSTLSNASKRASNHTGPGLEATSIMRSSSRIALQRNRSTSGGLLERSDTPHSGAGVRFIPHRHRQDPIEKLTKSPGSFDDQTWSSDLRSAATFSSIESGKTPHPRSGPSSPEPYNPNQKATSLPFPPSNHKDVPTGNTTVPARSISSPNIYTELKDDLRAVAREVMVDTGMDGHSKQKTSKLRSLAASLRRDKSTKENRKVRKVASVKSITSITPSYELPVSRLNGSLSQRSTPTMSMADPDRLWS